MNCAGIVPLLWKAISQVLVDRLKQFFFETLNLFCPTYHRIFTFFEPKCEGFVKDERLKITLLNATYSQEFLF